MSLILSLAMFIASLVVSTYANTYATERASNAVTDIFLSNIPIYNVEDIFVYGPLVFWTFMILVALASPRTLPFTLKSISLFTIIRAVFVSLTHIGPFPTQTIVDTHNIISSFSVGNDFFFSGHTGLPFLIALIFWDTWAIRIVCIAASIFFGIIVLLGHFHYSIDVLSAFFITYSIFRLSQVLFAQDWQRFSAKDNFTAKIS